MSRETTLKYRGVFCQIVCAGVLGVWVHGVYLVLQMCVCVCTLNSMLLCDLFFLFSRGSVTLCLQPPFKC